MARHQSQSLRTTVSRSGPRNAFVHDPPNGIDFPVVGLGASAGGLDASRKFITALPAGNGMAFILVQHLHPSHESMMADLLATHTTMSVKQAKDEMAIEPGHFYIIPPGNYLSIKDGILRLSPPLTRDRVRLPFDFLLHTMADAYGHRAICVILSGTGADGSVGLKSVKEKGGLIIAQEPDEASYDGMPRSAIATGAVDLILPVAKIPSAISKYNRRIALVQSPKVPQDKTQSWLPEITELLRTKTSHDFTLYKHGTLERRIERRMAIMAGDADGMGRYLQLLRTDKAELEPSRGRHRFAFCENSLRQGRIARTPTTNFGILFAGVASDPKPSGIKHAHDPTSGQTS